MAKFKKGQSGNPKGRPKGTGWVHELRRSIQKELPEMIEQMLEEARNGDAAARKLLLDKGLPSPRPTDDPIEFELPDGTPAEQGRAVLAAMASGLATPEQAARLLSALTEQARLTEITELEQRIAALEETNGQHK